MDVIIVCHTEFGVVKNKEVYFYKAPEGISGVTEGSRNLMRVARCYGAKVTFAIMPEVLEYFPEALAKAEDIEIGLHLHPGWELWQDLKKNQNWFMGDRFLWKNYEQENNSSVLINHSYEEQYNLIKLGKKCIKEKFGITPKVFVAGRWSENNDTIRALVELGFTHDCTVNPSQKSEHFDWSKLSRITMPYHPHKDDLQKEGDLPILIVPISQFWPGRAVNPEAIPRYGLNWLKACFTEYYSQGAPLFHIVLHSASMTNDYFLGVFSSFLKFISAHENVNFKLTSEIKYYGKKILRTKFLPYARALFMPLNIIRTNKYDMSEDIKLAVRKYCPGKIVLDLGCGNLGYSLEAKSVGSKQVIAVDIKKPEINDDTIEFIQADAERTPLKDCSVDVILCIGLIEYVDLLKCIQEIRRLLRSNGIAILGTKDSRGFRHKLYSTYLRLSGKRASGLAHNFKKLYSAVKNNFDIIEEHYTKPKHNVLFVLKKAQK